MSEYCDSQYFSLQNGYSRFARSRSTGAISGVWNLNAPPQQGAADILSALTQPLRSANTQIPTAAELADVSEVALVLLLPCCLKLFRVHGSATQLGFGALHLEATRLRIACRPPATREQSRGPSTAREWRPRGGQCARLDLQPRRLSAGRNDKKRLCLAHRPRRIDAKQVSSGRDE